ncbi:hypothetical protein AKO1_010374, partial [Acrasis kona]
DSLLTSLIKLINNPQDEIFIDRDPYTFSLIKVFLECGKVDHFPYQQKNKMDQLKNDAKFYRISSLEEQFDPLRYPIEEIGKENIEMKLTEDMYRSIFAKDRNNPVLKDPYLNLLPVFDVYESFKVKTQPPINIPLLFNLEDGTMFRGVMEPSCWELEGVNNMKTNLGTPPR